MSTTFAKLLPFLDEFGLFGGSSFESPYDPVWLRCMDAVLSTLRGLAGEGVLPGIVEASIIAVEQPNVTQFFGANAQNAQLSYPGIMVWPAENERTAIAEGNNLQDEIVYPVGIAFADSGAGVTGANSMVGSKSARRRHMTWREKISRKFRHFLCPEIPEIRDVYIRPGVYAVPSMYKNDDLFHGAIIVDFFSQEDRDNGGG
jgi:hypothetical protein